MIKITVHYDQPEQLQMLIQLLGDQMLSCRRAKQQTGPHKRAYIYVTDDQRSGEEAARNDNFATSQKIRKMHRTSGEQRGINPSNSERTARKSQIEARGKPENFKQ